MNVCNLKHQSSLGSYLPTGLLLLLGDGERESGLPLGEGDLDPGLPLGEGDLEYGLPLGDGDLEYGLPLGDGDLESPRLPRVEKDRGLLPRGGERDLYRPLPGGGPLPRGGPPGGPNLSSITEILLSPA